MAKTTIQLPKNVVVDALQTQLNVLQRKKNKETNLMICELLEKDIAELQSGINTATDK